MLSMLYKLSVTSTVNPKTSKFTNLGGDEITKPKSMRAIQKSLITLFALAVAQFSAGQEITTESLIREMTDMVKLAEYPNPTFTTVQYSSYDRRTVSPDKPGWFANDDGFGGEPVPGFIEVLKKPGSDGIGEYLICDVKGPGAIVRMWTAMIEGEITLWLDQEKKPLYQGPAQFYMQHTYEALLGQKENAPWRNTFSQNMASYYPVPFSKGCRMVWKGNLSNLHFYHVQVRAYPDGTRVKTFRLEDISLNEPLLAKTARILAKPFEQLDSALYNAEYQSEWVKPGEKKTVAKILGQKGISRLAVFVTAKDVDKALKQTILEIRFDGSPWGQVQSPIGDFFGAAPGINPYESLPFSVLEDGRMVCRYFMPLRDSAEVMVENMGDQEVTVTMKIVTVPYQWKEGSSMHFRARWRVDHELLADPRQVQDIPYLMLRGKGRMVGAAAYLMNPTSVPSSAGNWWGEGDEKIFVNNDLRPIFIGTGSEDYFNYAWSSEELFAHAYGGQPRNDGPANRGFVTNYRWHILDNIPFETGFDFYMELYSHRVVPHFTYARTLYTYALPGAHDDHMPITKDEVRIPKMPALWLPEAAGQASNSIFYQIEDLVTDQSHIKIEESPQWAGGGLAVWTPLNNVESITLLVPVTQKGKYQLGLTLGKLIVDYGPFVQDRKPSRYILIELDGKPIRFNGENRLDVSTAFQPVSRNAISDQVELTEGIHTLRVLQEIEGSGKVGLDFLWVKKI